MQSDYTPENKRLEAKKIPLWQRNIIWTKPPFFLVIPPLIFQGVALSSWLWQFLEGAAGPSSWRGYWWLAGLGEEQNLHAAFVRSFCKGWGAVGRATLNWRVPKPMWTGTFLLCEIWNYIFQIIIPFFFRIRPFAQQLESFLVICHVDMWFPALSPGPCEEEIPCLGMGNLCDGTRRWMHCTTVTWREAIEMKYRWGKRPDSICRFVILHPLWRTVPLLLFFFSPVEIKVWFLCLQYVVMRWSETFPSFWLMCFLSFSTIFLFPRFDPKTIQSSSSTAHVRRYGKVCKTEFQAVEHPVETSEGTEPWYGNLPDKSWTKSMVFFSCKVKFFFVFPGFCVFSPFFIL